MAEFPPLEVVACAPPDVADADLDADGVAAVAGEGVAGGAGSWGMFWSFELLGQAIPTLKLNSGFQTQDKPQTFILPPKVKFSWLGRLVEPGGRGVQALVRASSTPSVLGSIRRDW